MYKPIFTVVTVAAAVPADDMVISDTVLEASGVKNVKYCVPLTNALAVLVILENVSTAVEDMLRCPRSTEMSVSTDSGLKYGIVLPDV